MKVGVKEINAETGEEIFYERELTAEEIQIVKEREAEAKKEQEKIAQINNERQAIADRLGLTAEELKILLG